MFRWSFSALLAVGSLCSTSLYSLPTGDGVLTPRPALYAAKMALTGGIYRRVPSRATATLLDSRSQCAHRIRIKGLPAGVS